jgi:hypothetical protein
MTELRVCDACKRRVFVTEESCPFCKTKLQAVTASVSNRFQGLSRAQMLAMAAAVSSQVLTGCNDAEPQNNDSGQGGMIAGSGGGGVSGVSSGSGGVTGGAEPISGAGGVAGAYGGAPFPTGGSTATGGHAGGGIGGPPPTSGVGGVYGGAPAPLTGGDSADDPDAGADAGMDAGEDDV